MVGKTNVGGGGSTPTVTAWAYISVEYPSSSVCTATNGTTTLTAADTLGVYVFEIPQPSSTPETWTVSCTNGTSNDSETVSISSQYQCSTITLHYGRLPVGYQEVEYLESTASGGQYINTGIDACNETDQFEISYMIFSASSAAAAVGGVSVSDRETYLPIYNNYYFTYATGRAAAGSASTTVEVNVREYGVVNNASHQVIHNGNVLDTVSNFTGTFYYDATIYLFGACHTYGQLHGNGQVRIYSFVHKNNSTNTVLMNLVPCYRTSDDVAGMYDMISNTFFTNAGSGTFVVGADV